MALAQLCATVARAVALSLSWSSAPVPKTGQDQTLRVVPQSSQKVILDIQESADGTRLLTHDRKYAPGLWDAKTLHLLLVLRGHRNPVVWLSFSPDGKTIATVSNDEVRLWDSTKAKLLGSFPAPKGEEFCSATFDHRGSRLAIGAVSGQVQILQTTPLKELKSWKAHGDRVRWLEFSVEDQTVGTCSDDHTASVWSTSDWSKKSSLEGASDSIWWLDFSADGKLVETTSLDRKARVYESGSGRLVYTKPHYIASRGVDNVLMGAVFVKGKQDELLVADDKGLMNLLDPATGTKVGQLQGHTEALREIRVSRDRSRVATYGDDFKLKVWDVVAEKELPFEVGDGGPSAGEFSVKGDKFWVGYLDGSVRSHDLSTGKFESAVLGNVIPTSGMMPLQDGRELALRMPDVWWKFSLANPSESKVLYTAFERNPEISPNLRYAVFNTYMDDDYPGHLVDFAPGKSVMRYKDMLGARFSPDSTQFVTWHSDGNVDLWKASDGTSIKAWALEKKCSDVVFVPGTDLIASATEAGVGVELWNPLTGSVEKRFDWPQLSFGPLATTTDGLKIAALTGKGLRVWSRAADSWVDFDDSVPQDIEKSAVTFSSDGRYIATLELATLKVWSTESGKLVLKCQDSSNDERPDMSGLFSSDNKRVVVTEGATAKVIDIESKTEVFSMTVPGSLGSACYSNKGSRILTADESDGVTIWDATEVLVDGYATAKKLGNLAIIEGTGWLVYDTAGRFDASDPSHVTGAYFVKEWSGGLEAIGMDQLKQGFYEPGLLNKLMGFDKDPVREVPQLDGLHLYPSAQVVVDPQNDNQVKVTLTDRDDGGIGDVTVWVNGKAVQKKSGTGFFTIDLSQLTSYMLPEVYLPGGNVVAVTASNEDGTLTSPPVTLNIGFLKGLQAPDVKMHVLCVGIGDYAGSAGDLRAPPSDASALGEAIKHAAEQLLPGRSDVTVMTTEAQSGLKPTRGNIRKWFEDTAKTSAASDIVFVFLSGHGTNVIGDRKGYFFLTAEADPGDVTPSTIETSTVTAEDIRELMGKIPATKQVVVLDTCHSGAAAGNILGTDRSVSGDYQRAWESIKDATGTWMLAGSASDQLSYESPNVEHGVLTYALLEAIDKVSADGLRPSSGDDYFLDVERWLRYAAERVEGLKTEIGLAGIQKPEFKKSTSGTTFDLGVVKNGDRGRLNLKAPMPIVIIGEFEQDKEDPLDLEEAVKQEMRQSLKVKPWMDVTKHPNVYRIAGSYEQGSGEEAKVKVYLQFFDELQRRKTLETFEITGKRAEVSELAKKVREAAESKILANEQSRKAAGKTGPNSSPNGG